MKVQRLFAKTNLKIPVVLELRINVVKVGWDSGLSRFSQPDNGDLGMMSVTASDKRRQQRKQGSNSD